MGSLGGSFTTSKKVGFISSKTIFECYSFKAFSQFMIIVPRGTKMFFCRNIFVDFSASKERILLVLCLRICCNTAFFILMPAKRLRLVWQKLLFALFISFFIQNSDFLLANCCRREKKISAKNIHNRKNKLRGSVEGWKREESTIRITTVKILP